MDFRQCLATHDKIMMEGALGERLKREYQLTFDEHVAMAALIYQKAGRAALEALWQQYLAIAQTYQLPFLATTPTRRANVQRVSQSSYSAAIIADNVRFLRRIQQKSNTLMFVGGLMGCKGDAYTGADALSTKDALDFHRWQAELFAQAEVDFLYAGIMPTLPEAIGMAQALASTHLPYIISFTIAENGCLIDHTPICDAIAAIDAQTPVPPVCYMTNCIHPRIAQKALAQPFNDQPAVHERFWGIQANTSPLAYAELDGAAELHCSEPLIFAQDIIALRNACGLKIIGGCCGTDGRHMTEIAKRL